MLGKIITNYKIYFLTLLLLGLFILWTYIGIAQSGVHVDLARDLNEISNIWIKKIVWIGPMTSANFPTPPIYYYLLFPLLFLSGGNGLSVIVSHTLFALLALGFFAYFQAKSFVSTTLVILTIGLSPWWITSSVLPWNGHMYVSWVFMALTSLYFKAPIFLSATLFGISISINPVAAFALPILFYEWWVKNSRIKNLIYIILGLLLPWTPILIFELITKGFLTRGWLEHPSSAGLIFSPSFTNISLLINTIGVSQKVATFILLLAFWIGSKREKYWIIFVCLPLIFLILVSTLRQYYLFGLVCALFFTVVTIFSSKTIGRIILIILIIGYFQTISIPQISFSGRSIPRLSSIVDTFIQNDHLDKDKKYAVVSVIDLQNSSPQADDYRFFLRMRGFNVAGIDEYPKADRLLVFVEVPNFTWQNFEDWHIQRFGKRKLISSQNIDGIEIVTYGRE